MAVLGLHCCAWAFSSYGEQGLLFVEVHRLLIAVASRCRAWALGAQASVVVARGLSSCGTWALELRLRRMGLVAPRHVGSSWPGIEPLSPALTGGFLTTAPRGKS